MPPMVGVDDIADGYMRYINKIGAEQKGLPGALAKQDAQSEAQRQHGKGQIADKSDPAIVSAAFSQILCVSSPKDRSKLQRAYTERIINRHEQAVPVTGKASELRIVIILHQLRSRGEKVGNARDLQRDDDREQDKHDGKACSRMILVRNRGLGFLMNRSSARPAMISAAIPQAAREKDRKMPSVRMRSGSGATAALEGRPPGRHAPARQVAA